MSAETDRPRVYIVDSDDSARRAYRQLLHSLGYVIDDFADGASFLAAADVETAGCVVLDSQLGDMSGADLHARLRLCGSPLSVVFVCASGDVPSAVACMRGGASHYLLKPIREQQLLDIVNRALRKSSLEAEHALARRAVLAHLARLTPRERQGPDAARRGRSVRPRVELPGHHQAHGRGAPPAHHGKDGRPDAAATAAATGARRLAAALAGPRGRDPLAAHPGSRDPVRTGGRSPTTPCRARIFRRLCDRVHRRCRPDGGHCRDMPHGARP